MPKQYSKRFWISFWIMAVIFLFGWYFALKYKNEGLEKIAEIIPVSDRYKTVAFLADYFSKQDDQEKTFLVLFQNNMEIRPGGGFIGAFGIVKIKNGRIGSMRIYDSGNFDAGIPNAVEPPYPMKETLKIKSWQLRDSNYSPDFPTNAKKAEEFYYMGQGKEKFDGIFGITTNVLTSFLKITGPVELEGYPGRYADEDAILTLEYQVEKGFDEQGIARADRKSVMESLAKAIEEKIFKLGTREKIKLAEIIADDLDKKDIVLYLKDRALQDRVEKSNWAGIVDQHWNKDFIMAVDANLGAWKTDFAMKRSMDYTVNLSGEKPKAILKIIYNNTATQKDFMTKDYLSYLRVYAPDGSWLDVSQNFENPHFGTELGKKYFGAIVKVPLNSSKTVTLEYTLPKESVADYGLKIQKQIGINEVPVSVHIINESGQKKDYQFAINSDIVLNK